MAGTQPCSSAVLTNHQPRERDRPKRDGKRHISSANNHQGLKDGREDRSHMMIYTKQWKLHVIVAHLSTVAHFSVTVYEPALAL